MDYLTHYEQQWVTPDWLQKYENLTPSHQKFLILQFIVVRVLISHLLLTPGSMNLSTNTTEKANLKTIASFIYFLYRYEMISICPAREEMNNVLFVETLDKTT